MDITNTFSLTPRKKDGVFYIEWAKVGNPADESMHIRWRLFAAKMCCRDGGKYYVFSRKEANTVIRAFKAREDERTI